MRFAQILSLAVIASAVEVTQKFCCDRKPCGYDYGCNRGLPAQGFKISCPGAGPCCNGIISSKSKGQALNAVKAQNKFEELNQRLDWNHADRELEKAKQRENSCLVSKTFTKIRGHYDACIDIHQKSAAKEAESGKAANCFRKESKSHLMVIRPGAYEPLDQRELVDCDCTCRPLSTRCDNNACYC